MTFHSEEGSISYDGARAMWAMVVYITIRDMNSSRLANKASATDWVYSTRTDVCSMSWACDSLGLDYKKLKHLCLTKKGRNQILHPKRVAP